MRLQWYVGKQKIKGATGSRLRVRSAYRGKKIRVVVTGTRKGFDTVRYSSTSVPVRR